MSAEVVYRRVLRRETHAARTWPAVIVAALLALLLIISLVIGVWSLVDERFPAKVDSVVQWTVATVDIETATIVAGAAMLVIAVMLIALAIVPGRRHRRARVAGRFGLLVDDGVLADAAADEVALHAGVSRSQVSVTVQRRSVLVRVTPTSGVPVDRAEARSAAAQTLHITGFEVPVRVSVADRGVLS